MDDLEIMGIMAQDDANCVAPKKIKIISTLLIEEQKRDPRFIVLHSLFVALTLILRTTNHPKRFFSDMRMMVGVR